MRNKILQLTRDADVLSVDSQTRTRIFQLAIAQAIALALPLPSSPVTSLTSYFSVNHMATVNKYLSEINEIRVIDIPVTATMVGKFYRHRYNMVFEPLDTVSLLTLLASTSESTAIDKGVAESVQKLMVDDNSRKCLKRMIRYAHEAIVPEEKSDDSNVA